MFREILAYYVIPSYTPKMNTIEQIRKQIKNPPIIF